MTLRRWTMKEEWPSVAHHGGTQPHVPGRELARLLLLIAT